MINLQALWHKIKKDSKFQDVRLFWNILGEIKWDLENKMFPRKDSSTEYVRGEMRKGEKEIDID